MLKIQVGGVHPRRLYQRAQHAGYGICAQLGGLQQRLLGAGDDITHVH